jgi:ABC-type microcin C transport system permease subunit YejB
MAYSVCIGSMQMPSHFQKGLGYLWILVSLGVQELIVMGITNYTLLTKISFIDIDFFYKRTVFRVTLVP